MLNAFLRSQSGAVTVDWVVLTAALVGLGLAVISVVSQGMETLANEITAELRSIDPMADPFAVPPAP